MSTPQDGGLTIRGPKCGAEAAPKSYGPFFTPDPTYRVAVSCPNHDWRGPMRATSTDAMLATREQKEGER